MTLALVASLALLGSPAAPPGVEREILGLEERWRVAQHENNSRAMGALLSADLTFVGTSGSLRGRADFLASRRTSALPRALTYEYSDVQVRRYGTVAIVTGGEATTGEGTSFQARFTHVWAKQGRRRWQLVAIQRTDVAK
jgi:ketosteroid isomerase-like protein